MKTKLKVACLIMLLLPGTNALAQQVPQAEKFRISTQGGQRPLPQPTGYWEKTWGAIAPSPVGGVLGTALGASSKEEAEQLALEDCKAKGGGACEVRLAYYNQCAVMVLGDNIYRTASAGSEEDAGEYGIELCQKEDTNCRIYYSACTKPIFHKY